MACSMFKICLAASQCQLPFCNNNDPNAVCIGYSFSIFLINELWSGKIRRQFVLTLSVVAGVCTDLEAIRESFLLRGSLAA
jgi:hypothetical protein